MFGEAAPPLPFLVPEFPGIGGRIKQQPADFEVEEIPAYEPCGHGEFLYLWIEKCDLGAEYFQRQVARRLGLRPEEVGAAGLKDRRAITRQWLSVPARAEPQLNRLDGDGIRLLNVNRHTNKLKPGHLRGNRFTVRVRQVDSSAIMHLHQLLDQLRQRGMPNFYGPQRFGRDGETLRRGLVLLRETGASDATRRDSRFLHKMALSAVQSALFNDYLTRRMADGLLPQVLAGDVMAKWPFGGIFTAEDPASEQRRFDQREIVHTGPMFGAKMYRPRGLAAEREAALLAAAGLSPAAFAGHGKLLQGTRRHNLVYVDDLTATFEGDNLLLRFSLPAGSYATVLLRELMKRDNLEEREADPG